LISAFAADRLMHKWNPQAKPNNGLLEDGELVGILKTSASRFGA